MADLGESASVDLDDSQQVWEMLAERVDAFVAAWELGAETPDLKQFAPPEPADVRRLALVELVKVDLDYRWKHRRDPRRIEDYLAAFPILLDSGGAPGDLVYEEYHVRRRYGDRVTQQEYLDRFPEQAESLARLLGLEAEELTTALFTARRPDDVQVGQQIDDFDLLTQLGKGAFATVFLARQRSLQRLVALKVSADRGSEPQTLAQLEHPHIVRIYDQRSLTDRGLRLLYMQYIPGGTLQELIEAARQTPRSQWNGKLLLAVVDRALERRGESPPYDSAARARLAAASWPETVFWIGLQLASALDYAHRKGVLHRDIKPANVLLSGEATPKLVDFNISFCSKLEGATPAAYFGGSLAYMSPEQLEACNPNHARQADSLDATSDLYSLGVLLWELLTGSRPFRDEQLAGGWAATLEAMTARRRAGVDEATLTRTERASSPELVEALATLTAPDARDRYASASEAAARLRLCLQPEAQKLLRPRSSGWRTIAWRFPLATLMLTMVLPNLVAAAFNLFYNHEWIKKLLGDFEHVFWNLVTVINGVAFPLGIGLIAVVAWPIVRAVRSARNDVPLEVSKLSAARNRCLRLGHYAAVLGIAEWTVAGVAYPVTMHALGVPMQGSHYLQFIGSLALCGLIAASYPFFGVTVLTVRAIYPRLLRPDATSADDVALLGWLFRMTWVYLGLAMSLPLLGVALLITLGGGQNRLAMGVLGAGGLVGFPLVFALARKIQHDLLTLADVVAPSSDPFAIGTESVHAKFQ